MRSPRINLRPYRAEIKKAIKVRYLTFLGVAFGAGLGVMIAVHSYFSLQVATQATRNEMLEKDIAALEKQNAEIKRLRQEIAAAVARKQVVESLQANRNRAVMVLNHIAQPPASIYYRTIRQDGEKITLTGVAPSNTSVSALIKQIELAEVLTDPKLVESKAVLIDNSPQIEFTLTARVVDLAKVAPAAKKADAPAAAANARPAAQAPAAVTAKAGEAEKAQATQLRK